MALLNEYGVPYELRDEDDRGWARFGPPERDGLHWPTTAGPADIARYHLCDIPLFGRLASDGAVATLIDRVGGDWRPEEGLFDSAGRRVASVWRTDSGGTILPFDPDEAILTVRSERYRGLGTGPSSFAKRLALAAYYAVRPLVPRRHQIALRRRFVPLQNRVEFPRWPIEPCVGDLQEFVLRAAAAATGAPLPTIASWPRGRDWALVLTHDVETAAGRDHILAVRTVEEDAGVRSSWNLVPERYVVDDELVAGLEAAGFEVGVHGLRHDGRDLASRRTLERRLPEIRRWANRWRAVGFRSPATHRIWDWMPLLGFDYDSSYPDTDPYEPIAGGCCSWLPFFNGDLVELPITLPQDHTVFVILQQDAELWRKKTHLLKARGGMALLITHPDYLVDPQILAAYEAFVQEHCHDESAWIALPRDVSAWWRRRAATSIGLIDGKWALFGPAANEAAIQLISSSG